MFTLKPTAAFAAAIFCATTAFADCSHSEWGAEDEIGAANRLSPDLTLAAMQLVKKGEVHPLGIVVDPKMPAFPPRSTSLQIVAPGQQAGRDLAQDFGWSASYLDDLAQVWWGTGPQIDGLGHMGEHGEFYNCNDVKEFMQITGLEKLGIHNIPPIATRGVLIDMAEHKGVESLAGGEPITVEDLQAAIDAQGVEIREGDVILIHTGWTDAKLTSAPAEWVSTEPGLTNAAAAWLGDKNPIAVGSDTWGLEAVPPAEGDKVFYGHVELLKNRGVYILETMNTGRLAVEDIKEFAFVLGQARIKGAVQMIINPVVMW